MAVQKSKRYKQIIKFRHNLQNKKKLLNKNLLINKYLNYPNELSIKKYDNYNRKQNIINKTRLNCYNNLFLLTFFYRKKYKIWKR